jgi:lambda family phage portal protein
VSSQLRLPLSIEGQREERAVAQKTPKMHAQIYEAGTHSRRTHGWRAPTITPNAATIPQLTTLRDRSRNAVRNDGYARGIIEALARNIVGTGIKPLSQSTDKAFAKAAHAAWATWVSETADDGLLDLYGQQRLAVRCWLEAGEAFIRLRPRKLSDGLTVPLQIQVLEPEMCPHTYDTVAPNGNKVRAGIEFNAIGQRVAYYFYASRPGDLQDIDVSTLRRIPAESVLHIYDVSRAGQIRGIPLLTPALIKLRELDKYADATMLRLEVSNLFAGFLRKPSGDSGNFNPLSEAVADYTGADGRPTVSLEPGLMQELGPGEEMEWSDPPDAGDNYAAFTKQHMLSISTATGVPYEVSTGDWGSTNDRLARVILLEFRRGVMGHQFHIVGHQFCRPIWNAWLTAAWIGNADFMPADFARNPKAYVGVKWIPQGWPYIHPVQDVKAATDAITGGLTSRSQAVSESGEDAETIDAEQAADNARAKELGLTYTSGTGDPPKPPPPPVGASAPPAPTKGAPT